jgi:hypothetical protein
MCAAAYMAQGSRSRSREHCNRACAFFRATTGSRQARLPEGVPRAFQIETKVPTRQQSGTADLTSNPTCDRACGGYFSQLSTEMDSGVCTSHALLRCGLVNLTARVWLCKLVYWSATDLCLPPAMLTAAFDAFGTLSLM